MEAELNQALVDFTSNNRLIIFKRQEIVLARMKFLF